MRGRWAALLALACAATLAAPSHHATAAHGEKAQDAAHAAQARYEAARDRDVKEKAAAAAGQAQAEERLHDLRSQLDALAAQQQQAQDARSDASKALRAADSGVSASVRALHDTDAAITAQQLRLTTLEASQAELKHKLAGQRARLAALVRSAYAMGGDSQLKLLLAQDRVVDLALALQYQKYLEADRLRRIHALTAQLQSLAEVSRQVQAQRAELAASRQAQATRLAAVQARRAQRGKLVASLNAGYKDRAARMQALGRNADALEALVQQLDVVMRRAPPPPPPPPPVRVATVRPHHRPPPGAHGPDAAPAVVTPAVVAPAVVAPVPPPAPVELPFTGTPGHFAWPIPGRVIAGFSAGNTGLLIAGTAGEEVRAVADGRVAFANWLKGYGLLLIVDHGHGVMSLYANNDALLKNAGDAVHAGDALATVGSSGGQGRNALYFEIRKDGKAVDPRSWLRAR